MSGRVLVIGAINVDLVVDVPSLPMAGETVLGGELRRHPGGKGANQAVAASRAGASVLMIGAVGRDPDGQLSVDALSADGVDTSFVTRVTAHTGVALISVDPRGSNQIVVAPGANAELTALTMERAFADVAPSSADLLLASLEVPMAAVRQATVTAAERGMTIVINPAPAAPLPDAVIRAGPILTPNRVELVRLGGADDIDAAAHRLLAAGARTVVVTLGESGSAVFAGGSRTDLPGRPIARPVDTTGAGDTFSGAFAAWLCAGRPLLEAAAAANAAATLSVRAAGARDGMPAREEIDAEMASGQGGA